MLMDMHTVLVTYLGAGRLFHCIPSVHALLEGVRNGLSLLVSHPV